MTVGIPPDDGNELINGLWAKGIAAGQNFSYLAGVTAAGANQAAAFQLLPGFMLIEIDGGGSATGVALPPAVAGTVIAIFNNTAQTNLVVYPSIVNNGLTAAQDTINNTTSLAFTAARQLLIFTCAKNGVWAGK
jgi:hypothetical protein